MGFFVFYYVKDLCEMRNLIPCAVKGLKSAKGTHFKGELFFSHTISVVFILMVNYKKTFNVEYILVS